MSTIYKLPTPNIETDEWDNTSNAIDNDDSTYSTVKTGLFTGSKYILLDYNDVSTSIDFSRLEDVTIRIYAKAASTKVKTTAYIFPMMDEDSLIPQTYITDGTSMSNTATEYTANLTQVFIDAYNAGLTSWRLSFDVSSTNFSSEKFDVYDISIFYTLSDVSITYTVTFIDDDGTILKTETVTEGNSATAPSDPSKEGYTFIGWNKDFSNITSDLTVTAQYSIKTYTVIFIDWDGTILKTEIVEEGASATAPDDPTRDGYVFTGWDVSFSNVTSDLTVTAQYTGEEPEISNENLFPKFNSTNWTEPGAAMLFPLSDYSAEVDSASSQHYVYAAVDESIKGKYVKLGAEALSSNATMDVYIGHPATSTMKAITVNASKLENEFNAPTTTETIYIKLYSSAIDTETIQVNNAYLYIANEKITYNVTFKDYDGTVLKTETVEEGTSATAPDNPARDGYIFTGWDKYFSYVTSNLTVTAQYIEEESDSTEPVDGYIAKNLVSYGDWSYTFNVDWDTQYLDIEVLGYKIGLFATNYYYELNNNSCNEDYSHESADNFTIHDVEVESDPGDIDIIRYSKVDGVCIITSNGTQIIPGNSFANDTKTTIEADISTELLGENDGFMTFNIKITDITPSEEEPDNNELIQGGINDETGSFEDETANVVKTNFIDISDKKQIMVQVLTENVYIAKCYLYNANKELVKILDISVDKKRMFGLDLQKLIDEVINDGDE